MTIENEQITAVDEKGNKVFIPKSLFNVEKKDTVARVLAAGAFIAGTAGVVYTAVSNQIEAKRDYENLIADCLTENNVRIIYQVPIVNLEECEQERHEWADLVANSSTSVPDPLEE